MLVAGSSLPWEGIVKDECVEAGVSDFKLSLNRLFVGIAASQRNEDLREEEHRPEVTLNVEGRNSARF